MRAYPFVLAYNRKTPIWLFFSCRPAVPLYCRATPTDFFPFLTKPVSSTTRTPACLPQVLDHVGPQVIEHGLLIPVRLRQQPLDSMRVRAPQLPGQLPPVLAFHQGQ